MLLVPYSISRNFLLRSCPAGPEQQFHRVGQLLAQAVGSLVGFGQVGVWQDMDT